jgi:predicted TIM-barrel fold metal-dependent hydrolase
MSDLKIIDAHHHLWDLQRNYYPWLHDDSEPHFFLGDYSALKRDYLPDDYRRDADGFNIVATVHVEAEWDRTRQVAETEWIHEVAAAHGMPDVVVGHVWLAADNCEEVLQGHAKFPMFRGVRSKPITSASPDEMTPSAPGTMQDPSWRRGFAVLDRMGLRYDLRVPYWHLYEAAEIAGLFPSVPIVLNHTGFPWDRSEKGLAAWRAAMRAIAGCPNVCLKISELGLKDQAWSVEGNRRVVCEAIEIFGIDRCMWASNFPVAGLKVGYRAQIEGILEIVDDLPSADIAKLFHDNARAFYGIE